MDNEAGAVGFSSSLLIITKQHNFTPAIFLFLAKTERDETSELLQHVHTYVLSTGFAEKTFLPFVVALNVFYCAWESMNNQTAIENCSVGINNFTRISFR